MSTRIFLRHGTGYKLVNDGVDTRTIVTYPGHGNLQNTARYTAMGPRRARVSSVG